MPTFVTREKRLSSILQSLEKHEKQLYQHMAEQAEAKKGDERAVRVPTSFENFMNCWFFGPYNWTLILSNKLQKGELGIAITDIHINVFRKWTLIQFGTCIQILFFSVVLFNHAVKQRNYFNTFTWGNIRKNDVDNLFKRH